MVTARVIDPAAQEDLDSAQVRELVSRHTDHPSVDLAFNAGNRYFTAPGIEGVVVYREAGGVVYQFGGPIAAAQDRRALLQRFVELAQQRRCQVFAVQVRPEDVPCYRELGFRLNQMGSSYSLALAGFSLRGHAFMRMRNKLKQPQRAGVEVVEIGRDVALSDAVRARLAEITALWLHAKGRHVKLLEFLVGENDSIERTGSRCFAAARANELIAYITYVPSYGRYRGLMHDLTRRLPDAPAGTMELINYTALMRFQKEGIEHLNFGFTPFVGMGREVEGHSPAVSRVMRFLAEHGSAIYPAKAQEAYKSKWQPTTIEPEFMAFRGRFRAAYLWRLLRVTRAV
jgi:lysylphosphatidylglycerol synthetase-like protein (DUF2156 family)